MNSVKSTNWNVLLDSDNGVANLIAEWSVGNVSTRYVSDQLAYTDFAGEFRSLVRSRRTTEARRLARKALSYRNLLQA